MKFCEINNSNKKYFEGYILRKYENLIKDPRSLTLGMHDNGEPLGVVIFYKNNDTLELRSLEYSGQLDIGECEQAIVEFANNQQWDFYRIEYSVGGTKDFLDNYDFTMLEIGFFPMKGDVRKFHATLMEIIYNQGKIIRKMKLKLDTKKYKLGKDLTKHELDSYNTLYPYNRYYPTELNSELSAFMMDHGEPVAGVIATMEDGVIEFEWMDARGLKPQTVMRLIMFVIQNAMNKCPADTEVIICPFLTEVTGLISRFGFKESPENIETRIYSYYL